MQALRKLDLLKLPQTLASLAGVLVLAPRRLGERSEVAERSLSLTWQRQ